MSVTSSATSSWDWEVPPPNSVQDKLLVVSITKGDGTPLDASSITEEDIVEVYVRRAHTRPLGVLQYSVVESVILFRNVADVSRTHCILLDVMEFRDEAIMVQTMAPIEAQVTAFQSMWHLNPPTGEGDLHTPPYQTPPNKETLHHIHAQLGDLNDSELQQLVRDLLQEIAQHELTVPPSNPPPGDWACPSGSGVPEEDDHEVTFPGGGRAPSGPLLQSPSPALVGPDMGQLINALTSGLQIGTPKISTFSGNVAPGKTEVSYEQWSHEVQCIKDHYPE